MTDSRRPHCWVIIPAAGIGSRMQADRPKQYLELHGKTVLQHTLDCFINNPSIDGITIAIAEHDREWPTLGLQDHEKIVEVQGGQERCHSVYNALLHLMPEADNNDWVLVHDAARPCLREDDLNYLIETLMDDTVGGILAIPVKDTMKRANVDVCIEGTVNRDQLWHALTPQMFRLGDLFRAIKNALDQNILITDEASAIEMAGESPRLVEGHADNIKLTRPEDLSLASFYLQQQGRIS